MQRLLRVCEPTNRSVGVKSRRTGQHKKCTLPLTGNLGGIDRDAVGQGRRLRRVRRIPFGVAGAGRGRDGGLLPLDRGPFAPMQHRRRQPPEAAGPMLRVVPVEKRPQPPPRRGEAGEAVREGGQVLEGLELGLGVRVVVGGVVTPSSVKSAATGWDAIAAPWSACKVRAPRATPCRRRVARLTAAASHAASVGATSQPTTYNSYQGQRVSQRPTW